LSNVYLSSRRSNEKDYRMCAYKNKIIYILSPPVLFVTNSVLVSGPVALSTPCKLIAYGLPVEGTLSITKYEVLYEWDDENEENKKIDPKVSAL